MKREIRVLMSAEPRAEGGTDVKVSMESTNLRFADKNPRLEGISLYLRRQVDLDDPKVQDEVLGMFLRAIELP